ncbi:MAG: hypothetical protein L0228_06145 [Planctomycetes bacterium]|nr:hypothetical protein [Planctomycetota bacterium]
MRRTFLAVATLAAVGGLAASAQAVWVDHSDHYTKRGSHHNRVQRCVDDSAEYVKQGYHENRNWPWPYVCADRIAVREPFSLMVNNGWRRQNLLGPHHFDASAGKLTTAGELRVRWIMTQAPGERRTIFIERDVDPAVTADRLATARDYASQVVTDDQTPQVMETHLISEGRPASVVDATNVRFQESMPPPTLPAATASVGTGQ